MGLGLFASILAGLIAGFAAGKIMKGRGFGFLVNVLLGFAGALIGRFLFQKMGIGLSAGFVPAVVTAMFGAIVLLAVANLLSGGKMK